MATTEAVIDAIDQVIRFFNARRMDLPEGFFDRKTRFLIDGAPLRHCPFKLRLSGKLRNTGEAINTMADVTVSLNAAGVVETAAAVIDEPTLSKIRDARRS